MKRCFWFCWPFHSILTFSNQRDIVEQQKINYKDVIPDFGHYYCIPTNEFALTVPSSNYGGHNNEWQQLCSCLLMCSMGHRYQWSFKSLLCVGYLLSCFRLWKGGRKGLGHENTSGPHDRDKERTHVFLYVICLPFSQFIILGKLWNLSKCHAFA